MSGDPFALLGRAVGEKSDVRVEQGVVDRVTGATIVVRVRGGLVAGVPYTGAAPGVGDRVWLLADRATLLALSGGGSGGGGGEFVRLTGDTMTGPLFMRPSDTADPNLRGEIEGHANGGLTFLTRALDGTRRIAIAATGNTIGSWLQHTFLEGIRSQAGFGGRLTFSLTPEGSATMDGPLTIQPPDGQSGVAELAGLWPTLRLNTTEAGGAFIQFLRGGANRWTIHTFNVNETGGSAGSDLSIAAIGDDDVSRGVMNFWRASQQVTVAVDPVHPLGVVTKQYADGQHINSMAGSQTDMAPSVNAVRTFVSSANAGTLYTRGRISGNLTTDANGVVTVTHGLGVAPVNVQVTPNAWTSTVQWPILQWMVIAVTATTFQIRVARNDTRVALANSVVGFDWVAFR